MSQQQNFENESHSETESISETESLSETVQTIVEIPMQKILEFSKADSDDDAGEAVIEENLNKMKEWSDDDISEVFRSNGKLKGFPMRMSLSPKSRVDRVRRNSFTRKHPGYRTNVVKKTRKLTKAALRSIFKEEKLNDSKFKMPSERKCAKMANELISEENIRNKFDDCIIVYAN